MTEPAFSLTTYSRVDGFRTESGATHLAKVHSWGPGIACDPAYVTGHPDGVLVREIDCSTCLDSLPGVWEVQVPDKRFKTGRRTLYTGFAHEKGAKAVADQSGKKGAKAVKVTMREILAIEEEQE